MLSKYVEENKCVVFTDLSGFSSFSHQYGMKQSLFHLDNLVDKYSNICDKHQGRVIKKIGDSLFMTFNDVNSAYTSLKLMQKETLVYNTKNEESNFLLCAGIGYGECFIDPYGDCFGIEVNITSKLGEDLAQPGEILFSHNAYKKIQEEEELYAKFENKTYLISNLNIEAYKVIQE